MSKIGSLSFEILADTGQINKSLEATKERINDFSLAAQQGGKNLDTSFSTAAKSIEDTWESIGRVTDENIAALKKLEAEYNTLRQAAGEAFMQGNDQEYIQINNRITAIQKEISARKGVLAEVDKAAEALRQEEAQLEKTRQKSEQNAQAQVSLRTQLRLVTEQLADMEQAGLRGTEAYSQLQKEAGRLTDALGDARTQAKILAHDNAGLQGLISGASGVAGAFSAAQGMIGMFSGESENLQKVMLKVQSLIAVTNGLQQAANAINKDSYFRIVTLTKAKELFSLATTKASVALQRLGVSAGAATVAAKALMATLTLGLSAAITAIVVLFDRMATKSRQAAKAAEELNKKIADTAKEPISAFYELSTAWEQLGDDMQAKERFVKENQEEFTKLGLSVHDVAEAENLLITNKQAFISAQIEKAKSLAYIDLQKEKIKELVELEQDYARMPDYVTQSYTSGTGKVVFWEEENELKTQAKKKIEELTESIRQGYILAAQAEKEGANLMSEAGIRSITDFASKAQTTGNEFAEGTLGFIEQKISELQSRIKNMSDPSLIQKVEARITQLEAQKNALIGQDEFAKQLEEKKKLYAEYFKWANSSDEIVREAAAERFAELLKEGNSYLAYLEAKRAEILASDNPDQDLLQKLNAAIANEAKESVLAEFEKQLENELENAQNVLDMLEIIRRRKDELENDGSDIDKGKANILNSAETEVNGQIDEFLKQAETDYEEYLGARVKATVDYEKNIQALRARYNAAGTAEEKAKIQKLIDMYGEMHDKQISNWSEYYADINQMNAESIMRLGDYEQRRMLIINGYQQRIDAALQAGETELAQQLTSAMNGELIRATDQYAQYFDDISELSYKSFDNIRTALLRIIKEALKSGKITADEYKRLMKEIEGKSLEMDRNNPFRAIFGGSSKGAGIMDAIFGQGDFEEKLETMKSIFADSSSESGEIAANMGETAEGAQGAAGGAASTLVIVDAIIKGVYQSLKAVSDTFKTFADYYDSIGEDDKANDLNDYAAAIDAVNESAMSGWENLKSGNIMGAIADTIAAPMNLITALNRQHDAKIQRSIEEHQDKVMELGRAYNQLAWEIENALTTAQYAAQSQLIQNLREQQREYMQMAQEERDKKDADEQTAQEYEENAADIEREIADIIQNLKDELMQSDIKSMATEFGDALINAFQNGENAAEAWGNTVNDIIRRIARNMIISKVIEEPLKELVDQYTSSWVDENGNFLGWDVVNNMLPALQQSLIDFGGQIIPGFQDLMEQYGDIFGVGDVSTLSGALKGASQESIDLLAGQTNAVRVNQLVGLDIARDQLVALVGIQGNTNLIYTILQTINNGLNSNLYDPLRARGL